MISRIDFSYYFVIPQLIAFEIDILSVYGKKVLVSRKGHSYFYIYRQTDRDISRISILNSKTDTLMDATWTPHGNIVYTTQIDRKLIVEEGESGDVITSHQMTSPQLLSVSNDGIIYLADSQTGVHQSTDDGITWNSIFKATSGWHCRQVIKVTSDNNDDFWTLENNGQNDRLRVYSVDRRHSNGITTTRNINMTIADEVQINLPSSKLLHDGKDNILLTDQRSGTSYLFSWDGQYQRQLPSQNPYKPYGTTIDKETKRLFIGTRNGIVGVLNVIYEQIVY